MATEREIELAKQILKKLTEMDNKLASIEDSVGELNGKETSTSVEGKLNDVKSVHKGLQDTFTKGFADINEGIDKINKNLKQVKKNGKQVH
ncbi:TPA: chromosome segregation protein SMC [Bacillus wiedmannii]|uniref:chromosome segregation protein SMC n=1 Tax=Bacillus thuringiensis TaxID=1428 RepID=UPI000BFC9BDA|nr:chromosome segregation protein SMC [Bacillus thuringiensis]PGO55538.1 chromosome segregation protein SMC [Bacillus thuringiensis]HDR7673283.1 chromosome segregation protein SMC [Bacillus wiedmannii]